jgi:phage shock protein A
MLVSYVASLESRIEKLEKKLAQARRRKSSVTMTGMTSALSETTPSASQSSSRTANRRETDDMEELVSDFGYM